MSTIPSMPAVPHQPPRLALVVTARAVLWIAWLLGLMLWVPRVENVLQRFGLVLPRSTAFVVSLTHGLVPAALLVVLFFIALDATVSYRMRRMPPRALWSGFLTLAPIVAIILTAVVVSTPMLRVLEALSQ